MLIKRNRGMQNPLSSSNNPKSGTDEQTGKGAYMMLEILAGILLLVTGFAVGYFACSCINRPKKRSYWNEWQVALAAAMAAALGYLYFKK
jgi:hypothetical protein